MITASILADLATAGSVAASSATTVFMIAQIVRLFRRRRQKEGRDS